MTVEDAVLLFYLPALRLALYIPRLLFILFCSRFPLATYNLHLALPCYSYSLAACLHDDTDAVFRAWTVLSIYFS